MANNHTNSFHLVLQDGTERDITAALQTVEANGALVYRNKGGEALVIYAAGFWNASEVERKDDKG